MKRRSGFCSICGGPCTFGSAATDLQARRYPSPARTRDLRRVEPANDKILLARSPRHPEGVMTTLAGFVTGGPFEACVARGAGRDGGPHRRGVRALPQVQPWPFPQSCMVASVHGRFRPSLVLDDELLEAKWWDRSAVRRLCVPGAVMLPTSRRAPLRSGREASGQPKKVAAQTRRRDSPGRTLEGNLDTPARHTALEVQRPCRVEGRHAAPASAWKIARTIEAGQASLITCAIAFDAGSSGEKISSNGKWGTARPARARIASTQLDALAAGQASAEVVLLFGQQCRVRPGAGEEVQGIE